MDVTTTVFSNTVALIPKPGLDALFSAAVILMEETKVGSATALDTYLASDKRGKELLDIWDKTKREVVVTSYKLLRSIFNRPKKKKI